MANESQVANYKGILRSSIRRALLILFVVFLGGAAGLSGATEDELPLYTVLLKSPSAVEQLLAERSELSPAARRARLRSGTLNRFETRARADQDRFLASYRTTSDGGDFLRLSSEAPIVPVLHSTTFLLNAFFARLDGEGVEILRRDPRVRAVVRSEERFPTLDSAAQFIGADEVWDRVGGIEEAGVGIRIAIIDSGINQDHPMFLGEELTSPVGFPLGDPAWTNDKVIVARSYHELFPNPGSQRNETPEDELGHGTRVAGVAAGRPVEAPWAPIQGIAPMAYLGNYKIFGTPGANSSTTSSAIIAAINDAVRDGMDVINLSLGGAPRSAMNDPEQLAIQLAMEAGVMVVVAAGNLGPEPGSLTSPGTSPAALTVGAVSHPRIYAPGLEITSPAGVPKHLSMLPYEAGTGITIANRIGPLPFVSVSSLDPSELACAPLPSESLKGKVVLLKRGICSFQKKADHIFAAGAEAMVVYNDLFGGTLSMLFDEPRGPAVMIEKTQGEELQSYLSSPSAQNVQVTFQRQSEIGRFDAGAQVVTGFSGRGPTPDEEIKPDLATIGNRVYTASVPDQYVLNASGTSFATPMVAGAAALLIQAHPNWSTRALKSALVSTATKEAASGDGPARIMEVGNGLLDVTRAVDSFVSLDPVSLSFGYLKGETSALPTAELEKSLWLHNPTETAQSYRISYVDTAANPSVEISLSRHRLTLGPSRSTQLQVFARFLHPVRAGAFEGYVLVTSLDGSREATLPIWGLVDIENPDITLSVGKIGNHDYRDLEAALRAARPGNVVEIADDSTYSLQTELEFNQEGLRLNGLTLKARPGKRPILDGSLGGLSGPTLAVKNLERVTIQGLHIRGSRQGLEFQNSSGWVLDNLLEGDSNSSSGYGLLINRSRVHLQDNQVLSSGGAGMALFSSEVLAQRNIVGSRQRQGKQAGEGIFASSSDLGLFENRIIDTGSRSDDDGIRLLGTNAALKGNLVSGLQFVQADGVSGQGSFSFLRLHNNLFTRNAGSGVHLTSGSQAHAFQNQTLENQGSGFLVENESFLHGTANYSLYNLDALRVENGRVTSLNNIFASSRRHGIFGTGASLFLTNDTVYENVETGIVIDQVSDLLVMNSILARNGEGDLQAPEARAEILTSLVGDGSGGPGLMLGDPFLSAAEENLFSPLPGSTVIDAGSDEFVNSGFDAAGHERVFDGNGDGEARVDLGALEAGSDFSAPLIVPLIQIEDNDFLGLALTNNFIFPRDGQSDPVATESDPARVEVISHRPGGGIARTLYEQPSLTQEALLLSGSGWVTARSSQPDLTGFSLTGDGSLTQMDGVVARPAQTADQYLLGLRAGQGYRSRLAVVNPSSSPATVEIAYVRNGLDLDRRTRRILSESNLQVDLKDLFGAIEGGYVRVRSLDQLPIRAVASFSDLQALITIDGLSRERGGNRLFGAQLVQVAELRTRIHLLNLKGEGEVELRAIDRSGQLADSHRIVLSEGESFEGTAAELFGFNPEGFLGWLEVRSDALELIGALTLYDPDGNRATHFPLVAAGAREFVFGHVAETPFISTGLTLLNSEDQNRLFSIEVFDTHRRRVARVLDEIAPREQKSRLLQEWIPSLQEQSGGFIRIRCSGSLHGLQIFTSNEFLAVVPGQILMP